MKREDYLWVLISYVILGVILAVAVTQLENRVLGLEEKVATLENEITSIVNMSFMQEEPKTEPEIAEVSEEPEETFEPEWLTFVATAYCPCEKCCGKWSKIAYKATASGVGAVEGRTIAMSEEYAFGTHIYIEGMGERVCEDRGSAIGPGRIDVYFDNHEDALNFGMREVRAYVCE